LFKLGALDLKNAWYKALVLFVLVNIECTKEIIDPSNSVPASVLIVIGENDLQKMFSQTFEAMKSEIPCPKP